MNTEIEISPYGSLLVYRKEYSLNDVKTIIKEHKLRGLRIFAQLKNDRLPNLDFLSDYSFLEVLDITSVDDSSFNFLHKLEKLKELTISVPGDNIIDLSYQTNLESLIIEWRKNKILGLEKCNKIRTLCLIDYTEKDFMPVSSLLSLEDLKVKTAIVNNLNGLVKLTNLKSILLGNCKKLKSLDGIADLKNVTSLSFDLCPLIENYDELGNLPNLENLQLTDCNSVSSIRFIERLSALKKLSLLGNTDILDGDLIPAKKIKEVFYKDRKHYNIRIENNNYDSLLKNNLNKIKGLFK